MSRPCTCDRVTPGEAFVRGRDCARCWLWHNGQWVTQKSGHGHAVVANLGSGERGESRRQQPGRPRDERVGSGGVSRGGGGGDVRAGVGVSRPLPCVHEGEILHPCPAGHDHLHVRECREEHGRTTRERCRTCEDYAEPNNTVHFHLSAHGIGDAVVGLYAACGLADAGYSAVFHCRQSHWLAGVSHPGVAVLPHRGDHGADGNLDYQGQLRAGARGEGTRAGWYCDRVADLSGIPRFSPSRPAVVATPAPVLPTGYTLVAPFSNWKTRDYPHWAGVVGRVRGRVVIIGTRKDAEKFPALFGSLSSSVSWHWGQPPAWVLAAVANADHVYGNDSGVVHLAGLHGVPATAVTAHLPGPFLFAEAPTVRSVSPEGWRCSPCGWQRARGYHRGCDTRCAAMASVGPGRIPLPVLPQHELNRALHVGEQRLVGAGERG